jgi:peptidoglycan/xylan/chitin deacetylase (PgdA/CDA1 family)
MSKTKKEFTVFLSHDVDQVRKSVLQSLYYFLKQKRFYHLWSIFSHSNPYWCFNDIAAIENRYDVKSTFYFLKEKTRFNLFNRMSWSVSLNNYDFFDHNLKNVIKKLDRNGWEVGLHGSFYSYLDKNLMKTEKECLEKVIEHELTGIRQHYLNLDGKKTWNIHKSLGFKYDASYGLKNKIGFKGNKYQPFNPTDENFLEIPLALMDCNLFNNTLMADGPELEKIWLKCLAIIELAQKKQATLSILWHSRFFNENEFPGCVEIYKRLIQECKRRGAQFMTGQQIYQFVTDHKES